MVGALEPGRAEAAFKRLLPVLGLEGDYHLGLSRLYGAGMEVGGLFVSSAKPGLADQAFQGAAAAAQRLGRGPAAGEALGRLGELRLAMALPEPARVVLELAEKLMAGDEQRGNRARIALLIAEVMVLEGRYEDAVQRLRRATSDLTHLGDASHNALAHMEIGTTSVRTRPLGEGHSMPRQRDRVRGCVSRWPSRWVQRDCRARSSLRRATRCCLLAGSKGIDAFKAHRLPLHLFEMLAADLVTTKRTTRLLGRVSSRSHLAFEKLSGGPMGRGAPWIHSMFSRREAMDGCVTTASPSFEDLRIRARDRFGLVRLMVDEGDICLGLGQFVDAYRLTRKR